MSPLELQQAYTVLKLSNAIRPGEDTLTSQVTPFIGLPGSLILDVEGIEFNSLRIGELVNVHNRYRERVANPDRPIALVNLNGTSRATLERVHLDRLFALFNTLADALSGSAPDRRDRTEPTAVAR